MTSPTPPLCTPSTTGSPTPSTASSPAVAAHLDAARADVLAFTGFPKGLWRQIWSNNPRNASTGKSAGAPTSSGSSPAAIPLIRLIGAVLAEQHDEWTEGRRYHGLDVLTRSRITIASATTEVTPDNGIQALSA